jgi:AcrR family transcriptional regulator
VGAPPDERRRSTTSAEEHAVAGARQARREETRRRLVAAAGAAFVARGYAAVTLAEIAADAGLTKGAVYSNFAGKMDLALTVLAQLVDEPQLAIFDRVAGQPDAAARRALASAILAEGFDSGLFRLELEVTAEALRSPATHAQLVARDEAARAALAGALGRGTDPTPPRAELERRATALIAVVNGAALERLKSPRRMPDALIGRLLAAVDAAFAGQA